MNPTFYIGCAFGCMLIACYLNISEHDMIGGIPWLIPFGLFLVAHELRRLRIERRQEDARRQYDANHSLIQLTLLRSDLSRQHAERMDESVPMNDEVRWSA